VDEAVPPGNDDRLLQYTIYTERDGVSRKEVSVRENNTLPWGCFRRCSRSIQALKRSVSFMDKVTDGMIATTSPVCLNK